MPVNPYMAEGGLIGTQGEKDLLDDLVIESIQIHGLSVLYLPRTSVSLDRFYLEDPQVAYSQAVEIEMYLKSFDGFEGQGSFMSHMGIEIRDQVIFTVSIKRFLEELGSRTPHGLLRPNEGDLIWYPLNQKLFEVRFVEKFAMHYPLGALQMYDVKCELFEYSGQTIATGVPEIDRVSELSQALSAHALATESGSTITDEFGSVWGTDDYDPSTIDPLDDSFRIQDEQEADDLIDFSEIDVFSESNRW